MNLAFKSPGDTLLVAALQGYDFRYGLLAAGDHDVFPVLGRAKKFREIGLGLMDGIHG